MVRVLFAGIFTGFLDDDRNRIFTGDVVQANVLVNAEILSNGGMDRARNEDSQQIGSSIFFNSTIKGISE